MVGSARNRVRNLAAAAPDGDIFVAVEGGVRWSEGELECFAWVVVKCAPTAACRCHSVNLNRLLVGAVLSVVRVCTPCQAVGLGVA